MNADLDSDPATRINADPCGSGSETLKREKGMKAAQVCALINSDDMSASFSYARGRDNTKFFYNYFRKAAKLPEKLQ